MLGDGPSPVRPPLPPHYSAPTRIQDALALLDGEEGTLLIAGGQSLLPPLLAGGIAATHLVDIRNIAELRRLDIGLEMIFIGAGLTFSALLQSPVATRLPALAQALRNVGTVPIRNRATLGGNLAWGDPRAEAPLALMLHEAMAQTSRRAFPIADLSLGPFRTILERGEILLGVTVPAPSEAMQARFLELMDRRSAGKAVVSAAARVTAGGNIRFAVGGVFDRPVAATSAPGEIEETMAGLARIYPFLPDPFHSIDYRQAMATILLRRVLTGTAPWP